MLFTALKVIVRPRGHNSAAALSEAEKIDILTEGQTTQSLCQYQLRALLEAFFIAASTCRLMFMAQELLVIKQFTLLIEEQI